MSIDGSKLIVPLYLRTSNTPSAGQGLSLKLCTFCNRDFRVDKPARLSFSCSLDLLLNDIDQTNIDKDIRDGNWLSTLGRFNARHISRLSPLPVVVLWILLIIRVTPFFFSKSTPGQCCTWVYMKHSTAQHSMVTRPSFSQVHSLPANHPVTEGPRPVP